MRHLNVWLITALCGWMMITSSCTEVQLCNEDEHPHPTAVIYYFNWDKFSKGRPVDSMYVVAYRVINQWKSSMCVSTANSKGSYIYNSYSYGNEKEEETNIFRIRSGDYKFLTFSYDPLEFEYPTVEQFMVTDTMPMQDLSVSYRLFARVDTVFKTIVKDWTDYNAYRGELCYLQPHLKSMCYDTLAVRELKPNKYYQINFQPRRLTQHIDIYFDIEKDQTGTNGFTIDSVFAEMSGIPTTIDLTTGYIDITKTGKTMFRTAHQKDTGTNRQITCHASLDVPSIVQNVSDSTYFGPGIMQVLIYTTTQRVNENSGETETFHKYFQGKINIYHSLEEAKLIRYSNDGMHAMRNGENKTLHINARMVVNGEKIIENDDDYGGLDRWQFMKNDYVIIDI